MAWWTHLLFFALHSGSRNEDVPREESPFAVLRRALKDYLYQNFLEVLYVILAFFTYLYLGLAIITFFFDEVLPPSIPYLVDVLSEPYLGALGIYVVIREVEHKRGKPLLRRWGELFALVWFLFFVSASLLIYFSEQYHATGIYKVVVTNALAALIIRLGTLIR